MLYAALARQLAIESMGSAGRRASLVERQAIESWLRSSTRPADRPKQTRRRPAAG